MDLPSLSAAIPTVLRTLKQTADLAKSLKDVGDEQRIRAIQSELLSRIIETQTGMLEAQNLMNEADRYIRDLESQLAAFNAWSQEAERYRLVEPFPGTFVYALQAESSRGEPTHFLCPACFQKREKTIVQGLSPGSYEGRCPKCDEFFVLRAPSHTPPQFFGSY